MSRLHTAWWRQLLLAVGIVACLIGPGSRYCLAHPGSIAAALVKVQVDGSYQIRLRFDLLAYTLGELPNRINDAPMNALLDGPQADLESRLSDAKQHFQENFRVNGNAPDGTLTVAFPTATEVLQSIKKDDRMRLPVMATVTVTGHVAPATKTIAFQFDETLGAIVLTTELPYQEPVSEPVEAGVSSTPLPMPTLESVTQAAAALRGPPTTGPVVPQPAPAAVKPVLSASPKAPVVTVSRAKKIAAPITPLRATPSPFPSATPTPRAKTPPPSPTATLTPLPVPSPTPTPFEANSRVSGITSRIVTPSDLALAITNLSVPRPAPQPSLAQRLTHFIRYVKMGYLHILPEGTDHILFVLGLFLLSTRTKTLIKQVTAFTLAHSLTLALSLYGIVHLPATIVEPVIAASIAFVAIENLMTTEMKAWRLAIVFGFGLIHGLGFAEALHDLGLRHNDLLPALVGFNLGVEGGQLTVVAVALLLVGRYQNHPNYRKVVIVPGSVIIAVVAVFWMFQRIF